MSHGHSHPHHHAQAVRVAPSILRLSVGERLLVVAVLVAALWGAVYWVI